MDCFSLNNKEDLLEEILEMFKEVVESEKNNLVNKIEKVEARANSNKDLKSNQDKILKMKMMIAISDV